MQAANGTTKGRLIDTPVGEHCMGRCAVLNAGVFVTGGAVPQEGGGIARA